MAADICFNISSFGRLLYRLADYVNERDWGGGGGGEFAITSLLRILFAWSNIESIDRSTSFRKHKHVCKMLLDKPTLQYGGHTESKRPHYRIVFMRDGIYPS